MSNTDTNYLLFLHYLCHEHPQKLLNIAKSYPNQDAFQEHQNEIIALIATPKRPKDAINSQINQFNINQYKAQLDTANVQWLSIMDPKYPSQLKHTHTPPLLLFYKGNIDHLRHPQLGIVGPRYPSQYAQQVAEQFTKELCPYFVITSGLAKGIDKVAHENALKKGYPSIAVVGCGLDIIYPQENQHLFHQLINNGLILSEYPLQSPPKPFHFPQRNRIVSGLCQGILVCEAGPKSGALITARLALEEHRDVFSIPGDIFNPLSKGTHMLIQDGAKLTQSIDDILNEFPEQPILSISPQKKQPQAPPSHLTQSEAKLLSLIPQESPINLETLQKKSNKSIPELLQYMSLFEINNLVIESSPHHYQRN